MILTKLVHPIYKCHRCQKRIKVIQTGEYSNQSRYYLVCPTCGRVDWYIGTNPQATLNHGLDCGAIEYDPEETWS